MLKLRYHAGRIVVAAMAALAALLPTSAQQKGKASYYSRKANGARTSSGVRLSNDSLVCAHRTHPFGTLLLVRNPANGKQVVVKVIDRGPHGRGRIIDLSYEAARQLGIIAAGVAMVEVSLYDDTTFPYKPKPYELPEIDMELPAEPDEHSTVPEWQRKDMEKSQGAKEMRKQGEKDSTETVNKTKGHK